MMEKAGKQVEVQLEQMRDNITKISTVVDLADENYDQQPKFQKFIEKLEKRSDLKGKLL